ncbi:hypothetical protein [Natrinema sp. CGMCC1.2065]|uniref:hypothetical protein n=1 Tax=Natrinema sp. CGMCC1.2065 TaxID=3445767 RepID=UPI003F4A338D
MSEPDAYDPIECPVEGCEYENGIRSVAAHISGTHDENHSWDQLGHDGARAFVMARKRQQEDTNETEASELPIEFAYETLAFFALVDEYDFDSLDELDPFRLTNLYALLSTITRSSNDAREVVRDALLERIHDDRAVESDYGEIRRYTTQRRYVRDEDEVLDTLDRAGIDPKTVLSVDKQKLATAIEETDIDDEQVFETEDAPRIQRTDVNERMCEEYVASLPKEYRDLFEF